jgi:hypothetical protein
MSIGLFQGPTVISRNVCFGNYTYAILLMELFAEIHWVHILFEEQKSAEWVDVSATIQIHIREVVGSILIMSTEHPDVFLFFLNPSR